MLMTRIIAWMFTAGLIVLGVNTVSGQTYPSKPIRILASGIGGGGDFTARVIAQGLTISLGQQVIVENQPSLNILGETVSKASPDGYTLLVSGGNIWIAPLLEKMPYDPVRDFSPITVTDISPNILAVHPSLPVKSVKELIALAKAKPGALNYASGGTGGPSHLAGELFKSMAGVDIVRIPYKSGSMQMADLIGGQVQLTFGSAGSVTPHVKSAKLRALAATSAEPSVLAPGLPTVAASGLPGYEVIGITGVYAPARTPMQVVIRLNQELVRFLNQAEAKQKFLSAGVEAIGSSPEQLAGIMKSDMSKMGKVIREAGIKAD